MPRFEPEVGPPATTFITSLIATVSAMTLVFGFPDAYLSEGFGSSPSQSTSSYFWAIGIIALPLLLMLGSFFWLIIAVVQRSRLAR